MASYLSGALRVGVALGYAGLLAVNGIYGSGAFGVKTNAELSGAYPSHVTPAGFTFAIWGPIFLLQGLGTALIASGRATALGEAVAVPWLCAWFCECVWQVAFASLPVGSDGRASGTAGERLVILAPCLVALAGAQTSMLRACRRAKAAAAVGAVGRLEAAFLALPTGINAAWLAAASGIGLSLVAQIAAPPVASPAGGAACLACIVSAAAALAFYGARAGGSRALGLGYAGATCWACYGMAKGAAPREVKTVARAGLALVAAAAVAAVAAGRADDAPRAAAGEKLDAAAEKRALA